jgi:membrane protease YdiL (CAAX protease family)
MNDEVVPHSLGRSVALHLVPGALISAFFFLAAPPLMRAGYPALLALFAAILFVLVPFELGTLYVLGRRRNGRLSLEGIVQNREPMATARYLVLVPPLAIWGLIAFTAMSPADGYVIDALFSWMPAWSFPETLLAEPDRYPRQALLMTFGFGLVLNGIAAPVVEELYFRGFLLPRLPVSARWAPLLNVGLFSLYHFFSPWQIVTRIVALTPMAYTVARQKNLMLGVWVHALLNTLGVLSLLALAS